MKLQKTTRDGVFEVVIMSSVDKQSPITPDQIRGLSKALEDLAHDIRKLAKGLPKYDPKYTH